MDSQDITKVYRAYKVLLGMLRDRGYIITKQKLEISIDDFKQSIKEASGEVKWDRLNDLIFNEKGLK